MKNTARTKKNKMRASVIASISVASVLAALTVIGLSVYGSGAWRGGYYNMKCDIFRRENKSAETGKTVFVGDSITDFCNLERFYPDVEAYNRGISGDTTDGLLKRMDESIFDLHPSRIVFLMGINDLHIQGKNPDHTIANYRKIFSQIRDRLPSARLIIQSVYPVLNDDFKDIEERCSAGILQLNTALAALSEEFEAQFVDVYAVLDDGDGRLNRAWTDDGLHPNDRGYDAISQALLPYLSETQ